MTSENTNLPSSQRPDPSDPKSFDEEAELSIHTSPEKVALGLGLVALGLTLLSFAGRFVRPILGEVVSLFGVGDDLSVPSWYSSIVLLFAAVLIATIAFATIRYGGRYGARWALLAAIFLFLASDEMLRLHERMSGALLQPALEALGYEPTGLLRYPWVIVYAPLTLVFVIAYLKFWLDLPARIRLLFFAAGFLFAGGAIGAEMVNALLDDLGARGGVVYAAMTHLEEFLEMIGVVVFVYALLSYIGAHPNIRELRIRVGAGKPG